MIQMLLVWGPQLRTTNLVQLSSFTEERHGPWRDKVAWVLKLASGRLCMWAHGVAQPQHLLEERLEAVYPQHSL